jgi:phage-related baseplate assembly protein
MAAGFTSVDLSRLPAPNVVEVIDFEVIRDDMLADLCERAPSFDALVPSDPAYKLLEVAAYREMLIRQRVNDAAKAVMLAYAQRGDLDQLGALLGVERLILDPGNPDAGIPPTMESDEDFRRRIQLSPEGFSVAGRRGRAGQAAADAVQRSRVRRGGGAR